MLIFIDLDGTLTDTSSICYKEYKDGIRDFLVSENLLFPDAKEFVDCLKSLDHQVIILSDSHPKYVRKIAEDIFDVEYIALADKPNINKLSSYIEARSDLRNLFNDADNVIIVGDSALDIELARKLRVRSIYCQLRILPKEYRCEKDRIDPYTVIKLGPTYMALNYDRIIDIIESPNNYLYSVEAACLNISSVNMIRFYIKKNETNNTVRLIRCLGRQEDGVSDSFSKASLYFQILNKERNIEDLKIMCFGIENYLRSAISHFMEIYSSQWDYFTFIPDKKSTLVDNKLKQIFDLLSVNIEKVNDIFIWSKEVNTSIRDCRYYEERKDFLKKNLRLNTNIEIKNKNIVILDDQLTTGATAHFVINKLKEAGARSILFVAIFQMVLNVNDNKECPKCGKIMSVKTNRKEGNKFYSCLTEEYGGSGCGHIINID